MLTIRPETPADYQAIRQLTIDAFASSEFGHQGEAELVDTLRESCSEALSLVATQGDSMVGHIMFTPATLETADSKTTGMGLAPMSVVSQEQRKGIGAALMNAGLTQLQRAGCPFVLVLGHPNYYPRFGFVPAADYGVTHGFEGVPQQFLFIKLLPETPQQHFRTGKAYYHTAFGPQHGGQQVS